MQRQRGGSCESPLSFSGILKTRGLRPPRLRYMESIQSALVGLPPDVHLLGGLDQFLPEVGMGDADKSLGPLPGGQALQIHHAVLSNDIMEDRKSVV